jgi:hypothetical protein
MRKSLPGLILMGACAVAAIPQAAPAAIITNEEVHIQYDHSEFYAVAGGKEFEVVVRGNPTSVPQPQFEARLMQLLTQAMRSTRTLPTANPAVRTQHPSYRLVLVFNLGSGELGRTLCGDLAQIVPPASILPGRLTVSAAYCRNADPMTEAFARTDAASLDDPSAQALFNELIGVLFPNRPGLLPNRNMWNNGFFR